MTCTIGELTFELSGFIYTNRRLVLNIVGGPIEKEPDDKIQHVIDVDGKLYSGFLLNYTLVSGPAPGAYSDQTEQTYSINQLEFDKVFPLV